MLNIMQRKFLSLFSHLDIQLIYVFLHSIIAITCYICVYCIACMWYVCKNERCRGSKDQLLKIKCFWQLKFMFRQISGHHNLCILVSCPQTMKIIPLTDRVLLRQHYVYPLCLLLAFYFSLFCFIIEQFSANQEDKLACEEF